MKKLILIIVAFTCLSFNNGENKVFKCNSENAKKYHFSEICRGLNAYKQEIIKISLNKAKAEGLTLCKWED